MMLTKRLNQKAIAFNVICLGAVCLTSVAGSLSFISPVSAQYGLGLPKSASSGGATRSPDAPTVTLLVPRDGAKTLAVRPTFLFSINPPENPQLSALGSKNKITITFILRDGNVSSSSKIYEFDIKVDKFGLYKLTLPENAPALVAGKVQRWQIRYNNAASNVYAPIRLDADPTVAKAIASASDDLEKARIYTKNAYWYDAIDAYTNWLSQNPKDAVARAERNTLFKAGLSNHLDFMKKDQDGNVTEELDSAKLSQFINKLDESQNATSITLQSKNQR